MVKCFSVRTKGRRLGNFVRTQGHQVLEWKEGSFDFDWDQGKAEAHTEKNLFLTNPENQKRKVRITDKKVSKDSHLGL